MSKWNLPGGARIALSIVVNVEEGSEMNITEGDRGPEVVDELGVALHKPIRNYANESNYLYGLKAGAPRIMKLLQAFGVRTTFTAAAQALEKAPELTKAIVDGGHEVGTEDVAQELRDHARVHPVVDEIRQDVEQLEEHQPESGKADGEEKQPRFE